MFTTHPSEKPSICLFIDKPETPNTKTLDTFHESQNITSFDFCKYLSDKQMIIEDGTK